MAKNQFTNETLELDSGHLGGLRSEDTIFLRLVRQGRNDPVFFAESMLGIRLHDGQKLWLWMTTQTQTDKARALSVSMRRFSSTAQFDALLTVLPEFKRNILVPSNRWGKTLCTSVKHLWYCYYKRGVRGDPKDIATLRCATLNLSPHSNQCQAGYDYILDILSDKFVFVVNGESKRNKCKIKDFLIKSISQKRQILFKNNTSYRAVPTGEDQASSLAGTPYMYISYDECAQSLHLRNELPAKIMSRLIDFGGPLDLVSTPEVDKPSHQYFFRIAKLGMKGEEGWYTQIGKLSDNIFLGSKESQSVIASIKATDPTKYRQVAFGEFVTTGKKMFDGLVIERIFDSPDPSPVMHGHQYLISADWGFADTGDPTVFQVIDYTQSEIDKREGNPPKYRLVFREAIRGGSPFAVLARAKMLQREWNGSKFLHDASALGGVIIRKMLKELELHDLIDFNGSGGNKTDMLFTLLVVLSHGRQTDVDEDLKITDLNPNFGRLRSYLIPELEEQLGNYQYNPSQGTFDRKIEQDDVMALGQALWYLERKVHNMKVAQVGFNPLALSVDEIFPRQAAIAMKMKELVIPEKRIF